METSTPRVLVVDDNSFLRLGLIDAITSEEDLAIAGEAENSVRAVEQYRELQPDVVTMDYQMPGESGIEASRKILEEFPDAKIILLSVHVGKEDIWRAVQVGAKGYLNKNADTDNVLEAIREVNAGNTYFPAEISKKLAEREKHESLTDRELDVLTLIVRGRSNKQIMQELGVSEGTTKRHITHILEKLGVVDRTQAAIMAVQDGIVHLEAEE